MCPPREVRVLGHGRSLGGLPKKSHLAYCKGLMGAAESGNNGEFEWCVMVRRGSCCAVKGEKVEDAGEG